MELRDIKKNSFNVQKTKGFRKMDFLAGCVIGEDLYFSSWLENGFYKINLHTGHCIPLKVFEGESENIHLHNQAIYYEDTIWLIPAYAQNIAKINKATLEVKYIPLPPKGRENCDKVGVRYEKFKCCYQQGNSEFWLIPVGYNMILKVDMHTDQVREVKSNIIFRNGEINFIDAHFVGNKIWFSPLNSKKLVIFDTVTYKFQFLEWKHVGKKFKIIGTYKNWVLLLPTDMNQGILLIDQDTYEERTIDICVDWKEKNDFMYLTANIFEQYIFLVPYLAYEFIIINIETGEIQVDISFHEYIYNTVWRLERFQNSIKYNSKIIYTSDSKEVPLMIYDIEKRIISFLGVLVKQEVYTKFLLDLYARNKKVFLKIINQNVMDFYVEENFPLSLFCLELEEQKNTNMHDMSIEGSIGEKIFECIK